MRNGLSKNHSGTEVGFGETGTDLPQARFWLTSCSLQSGTDHLVAQAKHWKDAPLPSEVYTANVPNVSERWLPAGLRWVWAQDRAGHTCDERSRIGSPLVLGMERVEEIPPTVTCKGRAFPGLGMISSAILRTWVARKSPATGLSRAAAFEQHHSPSVRRSP